MREKTSFGRATEAASKRPLATAGGAVLLATALQQGIPPALDYFQAKDERTDAATAAHIETLETQLLACQTDRDDYLDRLMECRDVAVSGELELPPSAWVTE